MVRTQKLKLGQNSQTQNITNLKNSNCDELDKSNCDESQKLNYDKISKTKCVKKLNKNLNITYLKNLILTTKILTKPNNSKCDQTQIVTKLKNSNCDKTLLKL